MTQVVIKKLNYQEPLFYAVLFDDSKEGAFEVTPGHTKVAVIRKHVPGDTMLYVLQHSKSSCVFC